MAKSLRKKFPVKIDACGGKRKGGCSSWAGATVLVTKIKVAA